MMYYCPDSSSHLPGKEQLPQLLHSPVVLFPCASSPKPVCGHMGEGADCVCVCVCVEVCGKIVVRGVVSVDLIN